MASKRPFWIGAAVLAVVLPLAFFKGCTGDAISFRELRLVSKYPDQARPIAEKLSNSADGVKLAFRDMDIFGGRTRGWSSWIIQTSSLDEQVEEKLWHLVRAERTKFAKRLEALWVLWKRTGDDTLLVEMFELVREPGPLAVGYGRGQLLRAFEDATARNLFNVPASKPLEIDTSAFRGMLPSAKRDLSYAG